VIFKTAVIHVLLEWEWNLKTKLLYVVFLIFSLFIAEFVFRVKKIKKTLLKVKFVKNLF
jgi:hypothetical protein